MFAAIRGARGGGTNEGEEGKTFTAFRATLNYFEIPYNETTVQFICENTHQIQCDTIKN